VEKERTVLAGRLSIKEKLRGFDVEMTGRGRMFNTFTDRRWGRAKKNIN